MYIYFPHVFAPLLFFFIIAAMLNNGTINTGADVYVCKI